MSKELRFYLTLNGQNVEVNPVYSDFKIEDSPEKESSVLRRKFNGNLTFYGADFILLMPIEKSVARCAPIPLLVEKLCNGNYVHFEEGIIILSNAKFDEDKCTIKAKITKDDEYFLVEQNENKEFNILAMGLTPRAINFNADGSSVTHRSCQNNAVFLTDNYIKKCDDVNSPEWSLNSLTITGSRGIYSINSDWIKTDTGGKLFTFMVPNASSSDNLPTTGDFAEEQTYHFEYLGHGAYVSIDRFLRFDEVLIKLAAEFNLTIQSDFFQINPEVPSLINYVTGQPSLILDLLLAQVSDVQQPQSPEQAIKAIITWDKLFADLRTIFQVEYIIKAGILIIEHQSAFKNGELLDLTATEKFRKWVRGKGQYSYDTDKQPSSETWKMKNMGTLPDSKGMPITYNNGCTLADRATKTKEYKTEILCTDLYAVLAGDTRVNSDGVITSSSDFSNEAILLIAAKKNPDNATYSMLTEPGILTPYAEPNNTLSVAHLQDKYFRHNRSYRFGFLNNELVTFKSSIKAKIGDPFRIPMCCTDDIDLEGQIKTFLGTGEIQKAIYTLKDNMIELTVGYASDEFDDEGSQAPLANNDSVETKEEKTVTIDILSNDSNVGNSTIVITKQPLNGTILIVNQKIDYKPDVDFVGVDEFKYKLDKNGSVSNEATVKITVTALPLPQKDQGSAVVSDDHYEVALSTPLIVNSINGVLANDTFLDRRGNVVYNDQRVSDYDHITESGGTVNMQPDGSFIYNPPVGYNGIDTFTYVVYFPGFDDNVYSMYQRAKVKIKVGEPVTPNYAFVHIINGRNDGRYTRYGDVVCNVYYDQDRYFPKVVNSITVNYRIIEKHRGENDQVFPGAVTVNNTSEVLIQANRLVGISVPGGEGPSGGFYTIIETLIGDGYIPLI